MDFSLNIHTQTPTHAGTPSLNVLFTQNDLYSWVDIVLKVLTRSSGMYQHMFFETIYKAETFNDSRNINNLGSIEDKIMFTMRTIIHQ